MASDASRRGRSNKRKGAAGERELANKLTELTGVEWQRGYQRRTGGNEVPDVYASVGPWDLLHIECKRSVRNPGIHAAYAQAQGDCGERVPVVCSRRDREGWLVTVGLEDLLKLLGVGEEAENLSPEYGPLGKALMASGIEPVPLVNPYLDDEEQDPADGSSSVKMGRG
jgi:hypothetical protein